MKSIIVHYQEIALKGNNRPWFIARLARNLREATADLGVREVRVLMGRIEVVLDDGGDWQAVRDRIARVFGVGQLRAGGARAARRRRDRGGDPERSRRPGGPARSGSPPAGPTSGSR